MTEEEELEQNLIDFPPEKDENLIKQAIEEEAATLKKEAIASLQTEFNGVLFDAEDTSQNRMSATGTVANYLFIKNLKDTLAYYANEPDATDDFKRLAGIMSQVFDGVYVTESIPWKANDTTLVNVSSGTIIEVLYKTLQSLSSVIMNALSKVT